MSEKVRRCSATIVRNIVFTVSEKWRSVYVCACVWRGLEEATVDARVVAVYVYAAEREAFGTRLRAHRLCALLMVVRCLHIWVNDFQ